MNSIERWGLYKEVLGRNQAQGYETFFTNKHYRSFTVIQCRCTVFLHLVIEWRMQKEQLKIRVTQNVDSVQEENDL